MPHYKDGSEVKPGDILAAPYPPGEVIGVVLGIMPGTNCCNVTYMPIAMRFPKTDGGHYSAAVGTGGCPWSASAHECVPILRAADDTPKPAAVAPTACEPIGAPL